MSANGLQIITYAFPNSKENADAFNDQQRVNSSLSFNLLLSGDVRTLSTNSASAGDDRTGYLYVPALDSDNACVNASSAYVASNVTRKNDLPAGCPLIAVAPWLSPDCTLSYLQSAQSDSGSSSLVSAIVFFLPNTSSAEPPTANDPAWGLGDGGQWKEDYSFPAYAISTTVAAQILSEMSLYSGNTSSAPHGADLLALYGPTSYVRLYMDIDLGSLSGGGIPSIWVFLLIILAILLVAVGIVSGTMHLIQRRRRQALRRRIANGEVDVERLGIKRMTVPPELINSMPIYPYTSSGAPGVDVSSHLTTSASATQAKEPDAVVELQPETTSAHSLYQPTCAICLDDFIESESNVRELPCRHIFHPECIDTFLKENSSLCPMCKKSTLPKGYCPAEITNIMVRRERNMRRRRVLNLGRQTASTNLPEQDTSAAGVAGQPPSSTEMVELDVQSPPAPPPPSSHGRREWARGRALAMLGPRAHSEEDEAHTQTGSRPRKLLRSIFPAVG